MSQIGIKDNSGKGYGAQVDVNNRLHTRSISVSQQHAVSDVDEEAYQFISTKAITNSEVKLLLIKNTSDTKNLVITQVRLETIGAAASNASALWKMYLGGDYASGGTAATPVNMKVGSAITASGSFYDATASTIVTSGSPLEIDRSYQANTYVEYNGDGAIVLPKNGVLTISFTGSTVAGTSSARVAFFYDEPET